MSDLFHARVPLDFVRQVFAVIADTPQHTYQVLTKRSARLPKIAAKLDWPPNLWMGVSIEHRDTLFRADHLRAVPAAVRFLSCEPLLGPLDGLDLAGIDWVIAGGESGPDHRPLDPSWVTAIRDDVRERGSAVLLQAVGRPDPEGGRPGARRPEMGPDAPPIRGSAQPDHALLGQLAGRVYRHGPHVQQVAYCGPGVPGPPPSGLHQEPVPQISQGHRAFFQPLPDELQQLGMLRPGPQQHLLARQSARRGSAGPRTPSRRCRRPPTWRPS